MPVAIGLAELRSPLEKKYRNTVYCAATIVQDAAGKLTTLYCGNRWCLVCNRIRIARSINRYLPVLAQWQDPQFVTLTIPNVPGEELSATIGQILDDLVAVSRAIRRTDRLVVRALRKLECTYNSQRDDFHPHFHIVVEGRATADAFISRWLKQRPDAKAIGQDVRPCDLASLKELFKYFTKLIAKDSEGIGRGLAPFATLDTIFSAMKGRRVYQPMGFKVAVAVMDESTLEVTGTTEAPLRKGDLIVWEWLQVLHDWIDLETGDALSGYEPNADQRRGGESVGDP